MTPEEYAHQFMEWGNANPLDSWEAVESKLASIIREALAEQSTALANAQAALRPFADAFAAFEVVRQLGGHRPLASMVTRAEWSAALAALSGGTSALDARLAEERRKVLEAAAAAFERQDPTEMFCYERNDVAAWLRDRAAREPEVPRG